MSYNFSSNIAYHTRLHSDNIVKLSGGSFGGNLSMDSVNRLVRAHFAVTIKPSGRAVFVDRHGREVNLYISVDADKTDAGIAALKAYRAERARIEAENDARAEAEGDEIEELMAGLPHEEIVRRLKATS